MALIFGDAKGLVIVLTPDNLARMKQGDPFMQPDLGLMICYEEMPKDKLLKAMEGDPRKYLCRGWQNHPDDYAKPVGAAEGR